MWVFFCNGSMHTITFMNLWFRIENAISWSIRSLDSIITFSRSAEQSRLWLAMTLKMYDIYFRPIKSIMDGYPSSSPFPKSASTVFDPFLGSASRSAQGNVDPERLPFVHPREYWNVCDWTTDVKWTTSKTSSPRTARIFILNMFSAIMCVWIEMQSTWGLQRF